MKNNEIEDNIFEARDKQNKYCPKCNSVIIYMYGDGFDFDLEFCSMKNCNYERKYDTSTKPKDPKNCNIVWRDLK